MKFGRASMQGLAGALNYAEGVKQKRQSQADENQMWMDRFLMQNQADREMYADKQKIDQPQDDIKSKLNTLAY